MNRAEQIQYDREQAELDGSKGAVQWLSQDDPVWADGSPVAPSDRYRLLSLAQERVVWLEHSLARSSVAKGGDHD